MQNSHFLVLQVELMNSTGLSFFPSLFPSLFPSFFFLFFFLLFLIFLVFCASTSSTDSFPDASPDSNTSPSSLIAFSQFIPIIRVTQMVNNGGSNILFRQSFNMQKTNWVDLTDSESEEDSHPSDTKSVENQKGPGNSSKPSSTNPSSQTSKEFENIEYKKVRQDRPNDEKREYKPKDFMSIEALIKEVEGSKFPVKQLSIVFCHHLDQDQIKEKYSMIKGAKKYREGSYEITFEKTEDVFKFLKEKESNNDKFFIKLSQNRETRPPRENRDNREGRQPREPREGKNQYEYNKEYKQSREQVKHKRKGSYKEKEVTKEQNVFEENRWVFDEKVDAEKIAGSIRGHNLFQLFNSLKIVTSDASLVENCSVVADKVAKELGLAVKKETRGSENQFILSPSPKAEETKQPLAKKQQKQQRQPRQHDPKYQKQGKRPRKYYLSYNNLSVYGIMNLQQIGKEIKSKNLFNFYGAIRIKATSDMLSKAREVSTFICKEFHCQQIKEEKKEDQHILIISEKKEEVVKSQVRDNKVRLFKGVDVKGMAEEVRGKLNKIFQQFNSVKLEYSSELEKEGKAMVEELLKLKLSKGGEEIKNIEGKQLHIITFKEKADQPQVPQKQKLQEKPNPAQKQGKQKQKYKQKETKSLFNINQTNFVTIQSQTSIPNFLADFQKHRKEIFYLYKALKVQCSKPELFGFVRELGQEIKKQKVTVKESTKKNEGVETLVLEIEDDVKFVKKKIEVSHINDYLSP